MKEELKNLTEQAEKQDQTKGALNNLITALKAQVQLTKEEGELKLKEETHKRIECSKSFQNTMTELSTLIETHTAHNTKLREENSKMAQKLTGKKGLNVMTFIVT
jgi:hypothetical protein